MAIKVGILGFAHGHVNAYCVQWRDHPEFGVEVVGAWDHDAERLAKNAAELTGCVVDMMVHANGPSTPGL